MITSLSCGSWLACDGITSVYLKDRVASIAGKPAPTEKPFTEHSFVGGCHA
jgi:hypothetical protein